MATFLSIYASQHSQNSRPIGSQFKVLTRFQICHHIPPASLLISFLPLIPSILILFVNNNSIRAFLAASIGLQLELVLTLHLFFHLSHHIEILPTPNAIRPQFMLSNTSWAPINTAYPYTPTHRQKFKHLIAFFITMIEKSIQRLPLRILPNATN